MLIIDTLKQEGFEASFDDNGKFRIYVSGFFLRTANAEIVRKIKQFARDAHQLRQDSDELPLVQRFGCSLNHGGPAPGSEGIRQAAPRAQRLEIPGASLMVAH